MQDLFLLRFLYKYRDHGLLLLRIGIGGMFVAHGWPKMFGGPDAWAGLGNMGMGSIGITFIPAFWGFMAACAEFGGGLFLAMGALTRPVCAMMAFNMAVASMFHIMKGDSFTLASHAVEAMILFSSLILIGPGKFSVDELFFWKKN